MATWNKGYEENNTIPKPILLWQEAVHSHGIYDIEINTSVFTPKQSAELINNRLKDNIPFEAFKCLSGKITEFK